MFRKKIEKTQDKLSITLKNWDPEPHWYTPLILYPTIWISKFVMQVMNRVEIINQEALIQVSQRTNRGLVTLSNHNCLFDDPFLLSCSASADVVRKRYIAADAQNFFSRRVTGFIFSQGQCVPIVRGAGFAQPGFDYLKKVLIEGGWVHIFPEGTRNRNPENGIQSNFTQGIAHLILASKPLVLPFYHYGMDQILPVGGRFPRIGKKVNMVYGNIYDLSEQGMKTLFGEETFNPSHQRESIQKITEWSYQILKSIEDDVRMKVQSK
jgi:1-acyl-sn-glycerol-3-phosphate acyltransferase